MITAILIDGAFFLKRRRMLCPRADHFDAIEVCKDIYTYAHRHCEGDDLYRIFYYDCPPMDKKAHNPVSKKNVDFSKSAQSKFRLGLFEELKKQRKLALRLGHLSDRNGWLLKPDILKGLLSGKIALSNLTENDVIYDFRQKGVDAKIGIDIASLAFKKQVGRIVLIAGDGDFVPAAKLARREGIDFILDPMWNHINPHLFEHIDGLQSKQLGPSHLGHSGKRAPSKFKSRTSSSKVPQQNSNGGLAL